MIKVGLTGNIGSGKSLVRSILEMFQVPTYDADREAKRLMVEDPGIRQGLIEAFGPEVYRGPALHRSWLAERVFSDPVALARLNAIVHPAVHADVASWFQNMADQGAPYAVAEAALLVESGGYRYMDVLVLVASPEHLRLSRVVSRDQSTVEAVRLRMGKQMPQEEKIRFAHFVLYNDGQELLLPQILHLHRYLAYLAAK